MIVWTVANQKGGVGKTTTAVTLAGLLAARGRRVLLVDCDPHSSLTYYLGVEADTLTTTSYDLFLAGNSVTAELVQEATVVTRFENISLLPASVALATLDRKFSHRDGAGLVLRRALARVSSRYDHVLIDCPPVLGVLMVNALAASSRILVPVQTEFLALKGLERMMHTLDIMQNSRAEPFRCTVIPTMFDRRTKASQLALQELTNLYRDKVWSGVIPIDTRLRDASTQHTPANLLHPHARGVVAYAALLDHLLEQAQESQA